MKLSVRTCNTRHIPRHQTPTPRLLCFLEEANRSFSLEYEGFLSSHLVHGLIALERLGASEDRLQQYFNHYVKKLEPRELPAGEVTLQNWREWKGKRRHMADFIELFKREIQVKGTKTTLCEYLPELQEGLCGSAFHCLIETGYALMVDREDLLADGLGYWAHSFYSLGRLEDDEPKLEALSERLEGLSPSAAYSSPCPPSPRSPPRSFLAYLPDFDSPYAPPPPPSSCSHIQSDTSLHPHLLKPSRKEREFIQLLTHHSSQLREMMEIEKREKEGFQPFLHRVRNTVPTVFALSSLLLLPQNPAEALKKLSWLICHLYATSPKRFFLLHGVTSLHALHSIVHLLPVSLTQNLLSYFWKAIVATYLIEGLPPVKLSFADDKSLADRSWNDITSKAILTDEEHIPKLVVACMDFEEWYSTDGGGGGSDDDDDDHIFRLCAGKCVDLFSLADPKRDPHFIF